MPVVAPQLETNEITRTFCGATGMAGRTVAKATTGVIARSGSEMTEAHDDNSMHRKFVLQFHAARTIYSCATPSIVSDPPILFSHHVCNIQQIAIHNACVHLVGHDRTCQNPGDRHSATR
jgi:hypothetical protein